VRQRQQLRQQQQQQRAAILAAAAAAIQNANAQANANNANAAAPGAQNNINAPVVQIVNQPEIPEEVPVQPTLFNKVKELFICFFSSLFPSWDVNLYIENNPVAQPNDPAPNPEQPEDPQPAINQEVNVEEVQPQRDNQEPVLNEENQRLLGEERVIQDEVQVE